MSDQNPLNPRLGRRDAFRFVLRSGAVLGLTRIGDPDPVEAAEPSVEFQQGTLSGGIFDGWKALLAITGRAVRGTVYDPAETGNGRISGYRVRGTATGKVLELDFFEMDDIGFNASVGGGRGKEKKNGKTVTNFDVGGERAGPRGEKNGGAMVSKEVPVSKKENRDVSGTYLAKLTDPNTGETTREFRIVATANGKFTLTDPTGATGPEGLKSVAGRFGTTRDGSIFFTVLLPKMIPGEVAFDPSEVNVIRSPFSEASGEPRGEGVGIPQCPCDLQLCMDLQTEQVTRVTGTVKRLVGLNSTPLSGATVRIGGLPATTTDANGGFAFSEVTFGGRTVTAEMDGFLPASVDIEVATSPSQSAGIIEMRSSGLISVVGHIRDLYNREDIFAARVALLNPSTLAEIAVTASFSDGDYRFENVREGSYKFTVAHPSYDRVESASTQVAGPARPVANFEFVKNFDLTPKGIAITDGEFTSWTLTKLFEDGGGAVFGTTRETTGGNPGAFRRSEVAFEGSSHLMYLAHLHTGAVYRPSVEGAVDGVDYSFDTILLSGAKGNDHAIHSLLVKQGEHWFQRSGGGGETEPARRRWTTFGADGLVAEDFVNLRRLGPDNPDFSANGADLSFGYMVQCSGTGEWSGVDNFKLRVRATGA